MRVLLTRFLVLAVVAGSACTKKAEPDPVPEPAPVLDPLDVAKKILLNPKGYWEWTRNLGGWGIPTTPAMVGFSRQVVFSPDGNVYIYRDQALFLKTPYLLTIDVPTQSGTRPQIEYAGELGPRGLGNTNLRLIIFRLPQAGGNQDTLLNLLGYGPPDGETYESYRWHHGARPQ